MVDPAALEIMQRLWSLAEKNSARDRPAMAMPLIKVRCAIADERLLFYPGLRVDPQTGETMPGQWPEVIDDNHAERICAYRKKRDTPRPDAGGRAALKPWDFRLRILLKDDPRLESRTGPEGWNETRV